jgi:mannose-1-phosphate guanylyltransferase
LELAIRTASQYQCPVVLGLPPQRPETRFGYIQVEPPTEPALAQEGLFHVRTFAEKPDLETARRFLESGDFLWNSGVLLLPLWKVWELLERYLPDHYALFAPLRHTGSLDPAVIEHIYRRLRPLSLEQGILEGAAREMLALRCTFDWSDVGTWDEVYRRALKDPRGNVLHGDVIAVDITGCFVNALSGKPIALIGVSDLIVVDAEQALLICPRGASERVAELVRYLRRRKIHRLL